LVSKYIVYYYLNDWINNLFKQAFSSFTIITRELNVTNTSSLADFRSAVQSVCNMTLDEILDIPLTSKSTCCGNR
jgi:DNA-binding transcriptional regulator YbjK